MGFLGYPRADGSVGVRNHVVVMASVGYVNGVVQQIARHLPQVKPITHTEGCGRSEEDLESTLRTLVGLGQNPNVAAVLVVGLGTEAFGAERIAQGIAETGKPVAHVVVKDAGGSRKAIEAGVVAARELLEAAGRVERRDAPWDKLTIAVECGGSDALSGITANPAVGVCADWLVSQGGSVILSEITEMIGTEEILRRRAASDAVIDKIDGALDKQKRLAAAVLGPLASGATISPGNMEGGITSIQEKSLGCIIKGGSTKIQDVLAYGERAERPGLNIMDTPGSDIFSITGMAAGGAQVVIFTTGRGSPAGFPIAPVVKVSTNSDTWQRLNDDIDLNAGRVIDGASVDQVGGELVELLGKVVNGQPTKAEANNYDLLAIHVNGPAVRRSSAR
jgi:altronate dehydratase large subunit